MSKLTVDKNKCNLCGLCSKSCPFSAIDITNNGIDFNAACKMCKICIKTCPNSAIAFEENIKNSINKDEWQGIMVYVEHNNGDIHPVTIELIGKALELSKKVNYPVYCIFIGSNIASRANELLQYGVDKVFVYDNTELLNYRSDIYADVFDDCIKNIKPSIVLVGGTAVGRSLAPRLSTRYKTGLTADCTFIDIKDNTDLIQVRPAFGGNIMARIITPNSRPQFATVRYKIMDKANKIENIKGKIILCDMPKTQSKITVIDVAQKEIMPSITDANIIIAGGRGLKSKKDIVLLEELAVLIGGQTAFTRPIIEAGWVNYTKQIGLSGRAVKPSLIITCGISGAIQFTAGMNSADCIIAINNDKNAQIFKIAHYGIVGDLYEIIPKLTAKIKKEEQHAIS